MFEILICTALLGAPESSETCYVTQTDLTVETTCTIAGAMALAKPQARRLTYCRPAEGRSRP